MFGHSVGYSGSSSTDTCDRGGIDYDTFTLREEMRESDINKVERFIGVYAHYLF